MTKDTKNIFYYSQNKKPSKYRCINSGLSLIKNDDKIFEISYSRNNSGQIIGKLWRCANGKRVFPILNESVNVKNHDYSGIIMLGMFNVLRQYVVNGPQFVMIKGCNFTRYRSVKLHEIKSQQLSKYRLQIVKDKTLPMLLKSIAIDPKTYI